MVHSHRSNPEEYIELVIKTENNYLVFEIVDKGETFNIADYNVPCIEKIIKEKKNGSMGLILVKSIMDKIQWEQSDDISICRMFKYFITQPSA
jgi:serine/threonine-protein kinase RsbW